MTPTATVHFGDCIQGMADKLAENSVQLVVTSIPFGSLFMYSGKTEDIGNNADGIEMEEGPFGLHMRFFFEQLFRVVEPGCNVCIHIQQLLRYKNEHGHAGRRDFRHATYILARDAGFHWKGEFGIPKDPQAIAQRLKLHSLQFKTGKTNARNLAPAVCDFVLVFQKPGECATPVPALYDPNINPGGWLTCDEWIRDAHGYWNDIQETDVLDGWKAAREDDEEKHVCLARGSLVLTRAGYVPIEDVAVGDLVLTHMGRWRPVTAKSCMGIKPVVRTTAQGVADLRTTPEHRLYAKSCAGHGRWLGMAAGKSLGAHRARARSAQPAWMKAEDAKGSYVNLKLPPIEDSQYTMDEWWLVGRWLGDGHFDSRGRVHISCAHGETDALIARLGKRAGAATRRLSITQIAINDRDGRIRSILSKCGRGCDGKKLPAEALSLDAEKSDALLSGYLSADGHHVAKYNRDTASSVSRPLLLGMAMVAQRVRNVAVSVYGGRDAGMCIIEGRTMATLPEWVLSIPPRNVSAFIANDGAWKKVRSVEPCGEEEVWDIQVDEDESFTAEGCIVHNCPLQLQVIRRCMLLYSNPGELVLDPFMGIGSTAYVAIMNGRNAVGFELKESYHDQALRNVALAIQKVEAPDLFGAEAV